MDRNRFLLTAALLVVVLTLGVKWMGLSPLRVEPQAPPEIVEYSKTLNALSSNDLAALLTQGRSTPAVAFFYASWCPYCKKQFPEMVMLSNANSRVPFYFISVDENPYALSRFLMAQSLHARFIPYIVKNSRHVSASLASLGVEYKGGIPLTLLLDKSGKPAQMLVGYQSLAKLTQALDTLK